MKNCKTPGIDGFPAEFLKLFWNKIKIFMAKAINYFRGRLAKSLRTCIITSLSKGDKNTENIKNWRPLSMLSVVYKLALSAIANRIKPFLNDILTPSQTAFISGKYIADNTRLIMFTCEKQKRQSVNDD